MCRLVGVLGGVQSIWWRIQSLLITSRSRLRHASDVWEVFLEFLRKLAPPGEPSGPIWQLSEDPGKSDSESLQQEAKMLKFSEGRRKANS